VTDIKIRLTGPQYARLRSHLFPGDGLEAVALGLCGRGFGADTELLLLLQQLIPVAHDQCDRSPTSVTWPAIQLEPLLRQAARDGLAVLKVHSHPNEFTAFSSLDDASDKLIFESVFGWIDSNRAHASAILLPDGSMVGRAVLPGGRFLPVSMITVAGDDLQFWPSGGFDEAPAFAERHVQAFGPGTMSILGRLTIAVVGCSGTGSLVIEQLARLGVGTLILVDPDFVEERNLNRIVFATMDDARARRLKVDVAARGVQGIGLAACG